MNRKIQGASYRNTSDSVQGSFRLINSFNLAVTALPNDSAPIQADMIIVVATDYVRWAANATANPTSVIMPPGYNAFLWTSGEFLSVIRLNNDSEVSVIIPE